MARLLSILCAVALLVSTTDLPAVSAAGPTVTAILSAAPMAQVTGNLARGELISIYGLGLATGTSSATTVPLPTTLDGATVSIGGIPAPIAFASPTQLNVQVPFEILPATTAVNVIVTVGGVSTPPIIMNLVTQDVGLSFAEYLRDSGGPQGFPVTATNTAVVQAPVGSTLALFAYGLGAVQPSIASGALPPFTGVTINAVVNPIVTINGAAVPVVQSELAGVGVYEVFVTIPSTASGNLTVVLSGVSGGSLGPTGVTGATGATGSTGLAGATGPTGAQGANGANGATGPQGVAGSAGPAGPTGPQGFQGIPGPQGVQGTQGIQGSTGSTGATGPTGATGLNWQGAWSSTGTYKLNDAVSVGGSSYISLTNANSNNAPATSPSSWALLAQVGATGAIGVTGATGATSTVAGPTGPVGLQGATGPTGAASTVAGPTGPVGLPGATGPTGAASTVAGPTGPTGVQGLVGPTGAASTVAGPTGPTGTQGPAGPTGAASTVAGPTGSTGAQGNPGATGATGAASTVAGPTGPTGPAGTPGTTGATGAASTVAGPTGATGLQGPTGLQGATGATGAASTVAGPAGPTGPTGAASTVAGPTGPTGSGSGSLVFVASLGQGTQANAATLTTNSGGMASTGALMPISGYQPSAVLIGQLNANNGLAYFSNIYGGLLQVMPSTMTFTKMQAVINPQNTVILIGVTLTITAQLYRFQRQGGSGQLVTVPGAACTFTDASTLQTPNPTQTYSNIVPPSELGVCNTTFSATIPQGDSLMWLISMTSSTNGNASLTQSLPVDVSISLSQ